MSSAMDREAELDRLLSQWLAGRPVSAPESLAPLLTAADVLTPMRVATPSAVFARRLEDEMLRRARQLSAADAERSEVEQYSEERVTRQRGAPPIARPRQVPSARRLLWAGVMAATLLVALGGVFVVAADAQPGGALYFVRRFEQTVRSQLTADAAQRTQLHLDNADAALRAFNTAVAQHEHGARLTDALDTFMSEHAAARSSLDEVTDSATRVKLATALDDQRTRGSGDLRAGLASQDWSVRLQITQALGALGVAVPVVTQVTLSEARDPTDSRGEGRLTTVTVTGAGFQPGAQLLLKGAPAGTTVSVTGDTLVAQVRMAAQAVASQGPIAVGNPDGTTAASAKPPSIVAGAHTTPSAEPTKSGGDGRHKATPTP